MKNNYNIGYLNQVSGRLFLDLVEDLSKKYYPSILYTGNKPGEVPKDLKDKLFINDLNNYNRKSNFSRISSGLIYIIRMFFYLIKRNHRLLFVVSNPPLVSILILLINKLIGQSYIVLIYDIYPDILINAKKISNNSLVVKIWRFINKELLERAEVVITIGEAMKNQLDKYFEDKKSNSVEILVVPNAADSKLAKPIPKEKNSFSKKYNQKDKITVMYSGNFGNSHSFNMIINVASKLKTDNSINFFFVGEGAQKDKINRRINNESLNNVISLPWQHDSKYYDTIACADIALITMAKGTESLMVPSKIYYSMAVGSALLGIGNSKSELGRLINKYSCGLLVEPDEVDAFEDAIAKFKSDKLFLNECKNNSYQAYKNNFTRSHMVGQYYNIIANKLNG